MKCYVWLLYPEKYIYSGSVNLHHLVQQCCLCIMLLCLNSLASSEWKNNYAKSGFQYGKAYQKTVSVSSVISPCTLFLAQYFLASSRVVFSLVAQSCPTLCNPMGYSTPDFPAHHQLPEPAQIHIKLVTPSNHIIVCHPLLLLPSIFPSIRVLSNESVLCIR